MAKKKNVARAAIIRKSPGTGAASGDRKPVIAKQPRSKQQAAIQAGMFLQTDDGWSARYFDATDLRYLDRELFG